MVKFSSQMDEEVLQALRDHAKAEGRTLASVLTDAAVLYLERERVRPVFVDAAIAVIDEHADLLAQLAR